MIKSDYKMRREYFISLLGGKCVHCGIGNNLEFDHVNPLDKSFSITKRWSYSIDIVLAELNKCQLLCHKCHLEKNKIDNGQAMHGTITMYRNYRCRCISCKNAWNLAARKWKQTYRLRNSVTGNTSDFESEDSRIIP